MIEVRGLTKRYGTTSAVEGIDFTVHPGQVTGFLGNPQTLILDEPVNGLDPDGVVWVRTMVRQLAAEGRAVFLSSHLMSEMALTADHVIVIGRGRIIADAPVSDIIAGAPTTRVRVRTPHTGPLAEALQGPDITITSAETGVLEITGASAESVGEAALSTGVLLHELVTVGASLEAAYMALTADAAEYRSNDLTTTPCSRSPASTPPARSAPR